jgi:hypothetical protein
MRKGRDRGKPSQWQDGYNINFGWRHVRKHVDYDEWPSDTSALRDIRDALRGYDSKRVDPHYSYQDIYKKHMGGCYCDARTVTVVTISRWAAPDGRDWDPYGLGQL